MLEVPPRRSSTRTALLVFALTAATCTLTAVPPAAAAPPSATVAPTTTAPAAPTTPPATTTAPAAPTTPPATTTAPAAPTTPPATTTTAPAAPTTPPATTMPPAATAAPTAEIPPATPPDANDGDSQQQPSAGKGIVTERKSAAPDSGADWLLIGGVALATVAVGFGVTYGVAVARVNALDSDEGFASYRTRVPAGVDSCQAARNSTPVEGTTPEQAAHVTDVCDEAGTMETLEAVGAPIGILSGVTAAVLILMSDTVSAPPQRPHSGWRLSPYAGPGGAGAGLSVHF